MVTFEADFDAGGIVRGSKDAFQALNRMSSAVQILSDQLILLGAGGAGGAVGKLGAAFARLQPWIMVATLGMTALNSILQISNRRAREAADGIAQLGAEMAKLDARQRVAREWGDRSVEVAVAKQRSGRLFDTAVDIAAGGQITNLSDLQKAIGGASTMEDIIRRFYGDTGVREELAKQGGSWQQAMKWAQEEYRKEGFSTVGARPDVAQRLLRGYRNEIQDLEYYNKWDQYGGATYDPRTGGIKQTGVSEYLNYDEMRGTFAGGGQPQWTYEQIGMGANDRAARKEQEIQAMYELEQSAQRVGMYLADASLRFISGLSSARDIMAEIFMMAARSGLEQGFSSLYKGLGGALGLTASQAGAATPTGSVPGGGTGIPSNSVPGGR